MAYPDGYLDKEVKAGKMDGKKGKIVTGNFTPTGMINHPTRKSKVKSGETYDNTDGKR